MAYKAEEIARYTIGKCTDDGHPISNMQLQKILYCIQRAFLLRGTAAFADEIEAWQIGPVVPDVYYRYCGFGAMPIRVKYKTDIDEDTAKRINPVIEEKRLLKPWETVSDVHQPGKAWAEVYRDGNGDHAVIPKDLIRKKG